MYQVLYRKYRPKVFSDVYGQDHVTFTLKSEIKSGRISHAYLFTGSRGTGKTSCAKILSKAVNCENGSNGEPCCECEVCKGLENGTIYDVVEIDAASNNGVDNIRNLREEANYTPSRCKYRVYIIDEVHMLSAGAFNALLKTLEEPPEHVIFILATTEVHKLPATILSRCQRFDFKRIQPETMAVRLNQVAEAEGFELDDDAAILIARIADGALRDGLSILDQCAGRNKHITSSVVSEAAGIAGREALYNLSDCIAQKDSSRAVSIISELYSNSYDMQRLCVEMINHFRNFLIVKTVRKSRELIICTDDEYETIRKSAEKYTIEGIMYALDMFQNTLVTIKGGAAARIETEMAFVKLCQPKLNGDVSAVIERISILERAVKNGVCANSEESRNVSENAEEPTQTNQRKSSDFSDEDTTAKPDVQAGEPLNVPQTAVAGEAAQDNRDGAQNENMQQEVLPMQEEFTSWGEFMDVLHKEDIALFGVLNGARGFIRGDFFLIDSPNQTVREFIKVSTHSKAIKKALYEVTGKQYKLGLFKNKNAVKTKRDPLENLISQLQGSIDIDLK